MIYSKGKQEINLLPFAMRYRKIIVIHYRKIIVIHGTAAGGWV